MEMNKFYNVETGEIADLDAFLDADKDLQAYVAAVRYQRVADATLLDATKTAEEARLDRQAKWRAVRKLIQAGQIQPGIYRLTAESPSERSEGLVIGSEDYPELLPLR